MLTFDETRQPDFTGCRTDLATQMAASLDVAMELEIACGWYNYADPQFSGPPSKDSLKAFAMRLRTAYANMALITGLDPCEQLPSTKERLKRAREKADQIS